MTSPMLTAVNQCKARMAEARRNLDKARLEADDTPLGEAWREQAINEALDALAVAQELGIEPNERTE